MTIPVGVDFGTCFSAVSFLHGDAIKALRPLKENRDYCPSVFYYDSRLKVRVGTDADNQGARKPDCVVRYVKKKLAAPFFTLDGEMFEPKQIVGEIFQYLIQGADDSLGKEFHNEKDEMFVVITVPVKFQEPEIRLLQEAARQVKLSSERKVTVGGILTEPAAAALEYFGFQQENGKNILVYDLGGGTFDTAIVRSTGKPDTPYEVVGQDARPVGGNDWDQKMLELIQEKLKASLQKAGVEEKNIVLFFRNRKHTLLTKATEIKENLSYVQEVHVDDLEYQGEAYEFTVTREEFEERTKKLTDTTVRTALRLRRKYADHKVEQIILVGGSTYMPQIREAVEKAFPDCKVNLINPEMAVSHGGARYARLLLDEQQSEKPAPEPVVLLKSTHTYGIGYLDEKGNRRIYNMIFKDQPLPATVQKESVQRGDGLYSYFAVFESECEPGEENVDMEKGREIMNVHIVRDRAVPVGTVSVQKLTLTRDNVLELSVTDSIGGQISHRRLDISGRIH